MPTPNPLTVGDLGDILFAAGRHPRSLPMRVDIKIEDVQAAADEITRAIGGHLERGVFPVTGTVGFDVVDAVVRVPATGKPELALKLRSWGR